MDILKKIKAWSKKNKKLPWSIGVDLNKASDAAKFAVSLLTKEELVAISRHNRFKCYRNEIMCEVRRRHGIPVDVLKELTGLSLGTVKVLVAKRKTTKNG